MMLAPKIQVSRAAPKMTTDPEIGTSSLPIPQNDAFKGAEPRPLNAPDDDDSTDDTDDEVELNPVRIDSAVPQLLSYSKPKKGGSATANRQRESLIETARAHDWDAHAQEYIIFEPYSQFHLTEIMLKQFRETIRTELSYFTKRVLSPRDNNKLFADAHTGKIATKQTFYLVVARTNQALGEGMQECKRVMLAYEVNGAYTKPCMARLPSIVQLSVPAPQPKAAPVVVSEQPTCEGDEGVQSELPASKKKDGQARHRWTNEEIEALVQGVQVYKDDSEIWAKIGTDERFRTILSDVTGYNKLKDKYRLMLNPKGRSYRPNLPTPKTWIKLAGIGREIEDVPPLADALDGIIASAPRPGKRKIAKTIKAKEMESSMMEEVSVDHGLPTDSGETDDQAHVEGALQGHVFDLSTGRPALKKRR